MKEIKNNLSKKVESYSEIKYEEIDKAQMRMSSTSYMRPVSAKSIQSFETILEFISKQKNQKIILDMGCGTGESSFHLSQEYNDSVIIGIDKSLSRISRNNEFKPHLPKNCLLVRAELLDMWYLFYQAQKNREINVIKQYIIYPNPWPKKKHLKRRWYGNNIWPFIINCSPSIELRTNWEMYAKEFNYSCQKINGKQSKIIEFSPEKFISNFEKKYSISQHKLFKVVVDTTS